MIKKIGLPLSLFFLIIALLSFPSLCIEAAQQGLLLWFNKVIPSLLPFMIVINILLHLNGLDAISKLATPLTRFLWKLPGASLFAFVMGLIAGYPIGGKVVKQLVETKRLTPSEGEKTLCFCNNCGPLFIVGTVGTAMLDSAQLGYFLLGIHLLSALILSLLHRPLLTDHSSQTLKIVPVPSNSFSHLFNEAVLNAMDTIVCVGGYIIFFSVITHLLTDTGLLQSICYINVLKDLPIFKLSHLFTGLLELSNGVFALSSASITAPYKLALLSTILGFGGYCVYFQTLYVLEGTPLSTHRYFLSKCFQGLLSFTLTGIFYPFFFVYTQETCSTLQIYCLILFTTSLLFYIFYIHYTQKKQSVLIKQNIV